VSKLKLSIAVGDYDRVRPLASGAVQIDGVDPIMMALDPEEIFFRAIRSAEFDVCELSLSSFTVKTAAGNAPYIGIPVFPSRAFRHTSVYIRTDRGIKEPKDLAGRVIGSPEYQLTACVWARAILQDDYGLKPETVTWMRGGIETPGRIEKIDLNLPGIKLVDAPAGKSLSQALADGDIDGMVTPRAPSCFDRGHPNVDWLFKDPVAAATDFYKRTGIFPIMHILGVKKELAEKHPWLPSALYKAFEQSKAFALTRLTDTSATKITMPFVEERLRETRKLMGHDFWPYGLEANHKTLDTFLRHHHAQGLSSRRVKPEELFHPATFETFKI
jgi:4,5-dihydroxyphthalate decarboxylase